MNEPSTEAGSDSNRTTKRLRHRRLPQVTLLLAAGVLAVMLFWPGEALDAGMRRVYGTLAVAIAAAIVAFWFVVLSGARRAARWGVLAAIALCATAAVGAVRRVEFSGDMVPSFDWRWRESRETRLEAHRAAQQDRPSSDAASDVDATRLRDVQPQDTAEYRGANRDGVVVGPALARDWKAAPPRLLWSQPCGGGYASFAVIGNRAITIEQRRDREAIVCYDVGTGHELWVYDYPALFSETLGGDGPRATPAIDGGRVYSLGATGELVCLDALDGTRVWQMNILERNASGNLDWAMSGSPLLRGGRLYVTPGTQQGSASSALLMALDPATGETLWTGGRAKTSYASPHGAMLAGRATILVFDAAGLAGFDAEQGDELWRFAWTSDFDINAAQPIVLDGDRVLITSAAGCAMLRISAADDEFSVTELWRNRNLKCHYANPVVYDGHVYGLDAGILACLDLETGQRLWKGGRYGHGQVLLSHDLLVVLSERGELALVAATPEAYRELARIQAIEGKTWNNPVLIGNRALVRNHLEMACYELPVADGGASAATDTSPVEAPDDSVSDARSDVSR